MLAPPKTINRIISNWPQYFYIHTQKNSKQGIKDTLMLMAALVSDHSMEATSASVAGKQ